MDSGRDPHRDITGDEEQSFEEWIDQVAASRNLSKREVFDQMMSSYWIFTELTDFIDETGSFTSFRDPGESKFGAKTESRGETESDRVEGTERDGGEDSFVDELRKFQEMFEFVDQLSNHSSSASDSASTATTVQDDLEQLQQKFDSLRNYLQDLEEETDTRFDGLTERLVTVESETEDDELRNRVEGIEEEITEFDAERKAIENRLDKNFEHLEVILEHVIERIDELDTRVDPIDELQRWQQTREQERTQLEVLKREATRRGTNKAKCSQCGVAINLALLDRPTCPGCSSTLEQWRERSGLTRWFGTDVIEVGTGSRNRKSAQKQQPRRRRSPTEVERIGEGHQTDSLPDDSEIGPEIGFEWGGEFDDDEFEEVR